MGSQPRNRGSNPRTATSLRSLANSVSYGWQAMRRLSCRSAFARRRTSERLSARARDAAEAGGIARRVHRADQPRPQMELSWTERTNRADGAIDTFTIGTARE